MIKNITIILLLFAALTSNAQTVTVYNKNNLQPLSKVNITNGESDKNTITGTDGIADITSFKNEGIVIFKLLGYSDVILSWEQIENLKFKIYMSERTYDLNEAIISANRFEENRSEISQQILSLNQKDIEVINQTSTADLISESGMASVQKSQQGGGSPVLRGFEANKVLLVIDGVRMNNAIYRGGHLQNIITVDNSMLRKAEILFGPSSVIYGSDALGGVVSFYTRNPDLSEDGKTAVGANASMRYATGNSSFGGHLDFNIGLKKVAFLTSASYTMYGDLRQGANRNPFYGDTWKRFYYQGRINDTDTMLKNDNENIQKESGFTQYDFMEKILFKQSDKISHTLNLQYSNSTDIPRYDRLTDVDANGVFKTAQWYYGPQERMMASYNLNIKSESKVFSEANIILAYQGIEESRHSRNWNSSKLTHRTENVTVYSLNADFIKKSGKHDLSYGLEFTYNDVKSAAEAENVKTGELSAASTRYPDGGSTMQTAAIYISDYFEICKQATIQGGLRFTQNALESKFVSKEFYPFPFDETSQSSMAPSGSLGLTYRPGHDWNLAVNFSTGFRTPNVDDMTKIFDSQSGSVIVPNEDLEPEYVYTGEVRITKSIQKTITLEGAAYYTIINNALVTEPSTFNGEDSIDYDGTMSAVYSTTNKGEAYIYGAYAGIHADITPAFGISSVLNYTYGRVKTDTTDVPLDHIPPVFGKTSLTLKLKKFSSEFFVMYNGWKRLEDYSNSGEDNLNYATAEGMPAWFTLNIKGSYTINKYIQVQAALENITDVNYRVFSSGISAPGRNFILTLRGRF